MDPLRAEDHWQECFDKWGIGDNPQAQVAAREVLCASTNLFLACEGVGKRVDLMTTPVSAMVSVVIKMAEISKVMRISSDD